MKPNRSIPSAVIVPVLVYPDVREAVAWLGAAFGFVERLRIGECHRSQLSVGDGAVIVADVRHDQRPPREGEATHSVLVRVDDANAPLCPRASARSPDPDGADRLRVRRATVRGCGPGGTPLDVLPNARGRRP